MSLVSAPTYRAPQTPGIDDDQDRVADKVDACLGTPKGFRVDQRGCIVTQGFFLPDSYFEPDTAILSKPARHALDRVAIALKVQKEAQVDIVGSFAGNGTRELRALIADQRREALRQHLIKRGVLERRIAVAREVSALPPQRGVRLRFVIR